ncbi:MAG: hypothetical protein GW903_08955 [Alphaproteobacteria bacterium]|nr:hypothetical protein [Alphaproteobacteria bacterium]NCQ88937.1 hypothetical protein [Alphaproteobacteria bacterium]NCT07839.1 hypothetical protein [Alphaproteobacteria bacterium]
MPALDKSKNKRGLYGKIAIMALLDYARCDPRLTSQSIVMLQALGSKVNEKTIGLRTQLSIAEEMGLSHTAVGKHEKILIKYGYIVKKRRPERGLRNKYQYIFNLDRVDYPVTPKKLIEYRNKILIICDINSETPNGFKQRNPQKVKKSETSNGDTRIITKKESEKVGFQGGGVSKSSFKSVSVCTDNIVANMVKDGFKNKD